MKILAIIGSLRKKNTYEIIKKIEFYHNEIYKCEYEYLFLKDIDLKLCIGCFICISKGEHLCPLKDDRELIIKKIENSDGIILASPNYVMNVTWIMKNFIDRFAYTLHRPKYFRKKFMILINSGSYMGIKNASKALSIMASGGKIISKLNVLISPNMNKNKNDVFEKFIKKESIIFSNNMRKQINKNPSLGYLIWFSVFKAASEVYRNEIADYEYYKNKKYFEDIKLSALQLMIIFFFKRFFKFLLKKGII